MRIAMSEQHQNSEYLCKQFTLGIDARNVEFYMLYEWTNKKVSKFKCIGRIITDDDNDLLQVSLMWLKQEQHGDKLERL